MKRLLLALGLLWLGVASATAQCVAVGGVNSVPQTGVVCSQESTVPTYVATGVGIVPGTAPTDVACLTGSATKIVRLKRVGLSGTAGTAINILAILKKNASADTGGTAAVTTALPVPYPLDSTFPAVSATSISYTANPTINDTTPGVIGAKNLFLPVTSTASSADATVWEFFTPQAASPPVLRGIAQQICVSLGGVTAPSSGLLSVSFTWTEQAQ